MTPLRSDSARSIQKAETQQRILQSAQNLFADSGYGGTTVRKIAANAGVDAGLVLHYFESKEKLFAHVARLSPTVDDGGAPTATADSILATLHASLIEEPAASLAILRSVLTHPNATDAYRSALMDRIAQLSNPDHEDGALRATLISSMVLGIVIQRWLLGPSPLDQASADEIVKLLQPCVNALVG